MPRLRGRHPRLQILLAGVAVVSTWLTRVTGEALMIAQGGSEAQPGRVADHMGWANVLTVVIFLPAVATVLGVLAHLRAPRLEVLARVVIVVMALGVLSATVGTGHEGAVLVWAGEN